LGVLAEYVFQAIFFPIGWPLMKILTLGKYPAKGSWFSENPSAQWTICDWAGRFGHRDDCSNEAVRVCLANKG